MSSESSGSAINSELSCVVLKEIFTFLGAFDLYNL